MGRDLGVRGTLVLLTVLCGLVAALPSSAAAAPSGITIDEEPPANFATVARWDHTDITYAFLNGTPDLPGDTERQAVREGMALWLGPPPITFTETTPALADITFSWERGDHGDGSPFEAPPGGPLAHAFFPPDPGQVHFNDDWIWTDGPGGATSPGPIDLVTVAAHEVGHALGLAHSTDPGAVMFGGPYDGSQRFLGADDIAGILSLYPDRQYMLGTSSSAGIASWGQLLPTMSQPVKIGVGDVDADADADVIGVESSGEGQFRYMWGVSNGQGVTSWSSVLNGMSRPTAMGVGDLTGDGKADIVGVESEGNGKFRYMLGTSNGAGIASWNPVLSGMSEPEAVGVGDVSGDGNADVVAIESEGNGKFRYMLGTSNGAGIASWKSVLSGMSPAVALAVGDLTGGGKADIVGVESEGNGKFRYMLGTSNGAGIASWNPVLSGMSRPTGISGGVQGGADGAVAIGDANGDGKADIIGVESEGNGKFRYMRGISNGPGIASWSQVLSGMSSPTALAVGDFTGDGKADVIGVERY
jgi:Matrixin/FG-GAP-like repeat